MKFELIILVTTFISVSFGAKILGIYPTPSHSHNVVFRALSEELVKRGHHMTIIAAYSANYDNQKIYENLTKIDVYDFSHEIYTKKFNFANEYFKDPSPRKIVLGFYNMLLEVCDAQFSNPEVQRLLHDNTQHFDLVISEAIMPVASTFKVKYNAPLILATSLGFAPHHFDILGNPVHPFLYPDNFAPYDPNSMRIWEKIDLLYRYIAYRIYYYLIYMPKFNALQKKFFGPHYESLSTIESEADLLLVDYNPIWHGVMPLVPAAIGISGLHIKPPSPLPDHLQKLLDDSPEGVIYFSFGSNVKAKNLPDAKRSIFVETFRKLPYKVIWKWEDENLPGKPDNVHISKWLPQMDILAHPNVKVFITQGGQQSIEEAIHIGVPMLSIPFVFDQIANAFRVQKHGVGRSLPLEKLNEQTLRDALIDIITNPKYRKNVLKLHNLIEDQPQSALERAVWWTEYVIRHKGARHLRSPAAGVSFIQYYMLDCLLFVIICIGLAVYPLIQLRRFMSKYTIRIRTDKKKLS